MARRTRTIAKRLFRFLVALATVGFAYLAYVYLTLPDVRWLAGTNPTTTAFMELRIREAADAGRKFQIRHRWVPYNQISANLRRAVIVTEDAAFYDHDGIDLTELKASLEKNWEEGQFLRGGSTITQQLAKNLYLSPTRNPMRKVKELLIARRLEAALSKRRIFEIYLNMIEWGDGIFGCEAAARAYFGGPCASLGVEQAALLAGAIINPREHSPARPTRRLLRRQQIIVRRMGIKETPPPAVMPTPSPVDQTPPAPPPAPVPFESGTPAVPQARPQPFPIPPGAAWPSVLLPLAGARQDHDRQGSLGAAEGGAGALEAPFRPCHRVRRSGQAWREDVAPGRHSVDTTASETPDARS